MRFAMSSSPHIRCGDNTRRIMLDVLIALLPTLLAGTIFFGLRCLLLAAVSIAAAGLAEALWSKLTGRYQARTFSIPRWRPAPCCCCCFPRP